MGDLLEAGAELAAEGLDVIAPRLHRAGEGGVGHQDGRGRIAGQGAAGQPLAALGGEGALAAVTASMVSAISR